MRLIFLSNFYPPISRGGYEMWCHEVAEGLRNKGHEVLVLTSNFLGSTQNLSDPDWVMRNLHLEMEFGEYSNVLRFFFKRKRLREGNKNILGELLEDFKPHAACVWGMWNLDRSLLQVIEDRLTGRVVYYMGDYWPFLASQYELYWKAPAKNVSMSIPKKVLGIVAQMLLERDEIQSYRVKFDHVLFPSSFLQKEYIDKGFLPENSQIIYGSVNVHNYSGIVKPLNNNNRLKLLYAGRLVHDKGVHTAIEAASILVDEKKFTHFELRIVGSGDKIYEKSLHQLVKSRNLDSFVSFDRPYPIDRMPELYSQADILLFTSIWKEPFGRVLVEAMASGVVVIGTTVGGASEILIDGITGLTYPPGDPELLANQILKLFSDQELYKFLSREGKRSAIDKFSSERMVCEFGQFFNNLLDDKFLQ